MAQQDLLWMKDFLQEELYLLPADKISSVRTDAAPAPLVTPAITPGETFNCLGPVRSGFLVVVSYAGDEHMPVLHQQALSGILGRKDLKDQQYTILNLAKHTWAMYEHIIKHFAPQKMLIMGADALPQGLAPAALNSITDVAGTKVLYAQSFDEMLPAEDKKRAFWAEMKNF